MVDAGLVEITERQQGEIPQRILELPEDDPERLRFLRGWEERLMGRNAPSEYRLTAKIRQRFRGLPVNLPLIFALLFIAAFAAALIHAAENYVDKVFELRHDIRLTLARKGYGHVDPETQRLAGRARQTAFLPSLYEILAEALALPVKRDGEEAETYLDYLRRTGRLFANVEGMDWLVDAYRGSGPR